MHSARWFSGFTSIIAWFALLLQLYILISNTPENGLTAWQAVARFLAFFTVLSNLLVATATGVMAFLPQSHIAFFFYRPSASAAVALYILIVAIVYNLVLRPLWRPEGMQRLADELLHVVIPLLYLAYWLMFAAKKSLSKNQALIWLIFPFTYLVYALIRGHYEHFYPYPFIDAAQLGYPRVFLNSSFMLAAFVACGLLLIKLSRKLSRTNEHEQPDKKIVQ
jgi:hypothetical protein